MATTGILGAYVLGINTPQAIYVCDRSLPSVITINVCNKNLFSSARIKIAISTTQNLSGIVSWLEYNTSILPNANIERSAIMVPSGNYLIVESDSPDVNAVCWGVTSGTAVAVTPITVNLGSTPVWTSSPSLGSVFVGDSFVSSVSATDADGGALIYALSAGTLPTGLSLSSTGTISGIVDLTNPAGTNTFSVSATDTFNTVSQDFSLVVNKAAGTGGSTSVVGPYTYHTFTSASTFTVTQSGYVEILAWGGGGGGGTPGGWSYGAPGGAGGFISGKMTVTAGQNYSVVVGGGGAVNASSYAAGGGGRGTNNGSDNRYGSGGGGYSGIFLGSVTQANALLIAGGGGGGGSSRAGTGNQGGGGGGLVAQDGVSAYDGKTSYRGQAGTQSSAGGTASSDSANGGNEQGALLGGSPRTNSYGGGGGGGYWGGSAGGYSESNTMAGGGGGSSFAAGSVTNVVHAGGNYTTPGNSSNSLRGSYGNAGNPSVAGTQGVLYVRYYT